MNQGTRRARFIKTTPGKQNFLLLSLQEDIFATAIGVCTVNNNLNSPQNRRWWAQSAETLNCLHCVNGTHAEAVTPTQQENRN
jgi:hypothetical protein